ncbi:MAG: hypothetical protein NZ561_11850 [Phycisphaerae bacterium]|nr:hypothetical protein [Phycisphaerae bacterium]MDW8262127.1 hypothetical protein [Phycisphaerales bacterium]
MLRVVLIALLLAPPCFGWGGKEHVQFTRMAAARLLADPDTPPAMKQWLGRIVPVILDDAGERQFLLTARVRTDLNNSGGGVLYWVMEPDHRAQNDPRTLTRPPFDRHERLMHYIDLEFFHPGESRRRYQDDLSGKPPIESIPRDWRDPRYVRAGYLPFALEHAFRQLVQAIRAGRLAPQEGVGNSDDDTAMRWAGYLAHYAQDNTQPHHSTIDYKSQSYFADPLRAPNVHAEFEWRLVDDEHREFPELRQQYWEHFTAALREGHDPIQTEDVWRATLEVCYISYDALPLIGRAAAASVVQGSPNQPPSLDTERFFCFRGHYRGREMSVLELKARQTAWAVLRTQRLWLAAWHEATR